LNDEFWMRRALRLAGKGFTAPNPMVGCVLVKDGHVVGEGYHRYAGQPHAEVEGLAAAGENAAGATAYVSLEPCSHWGRTPPCADALIAARVARVVSAIEDPNPRVSGSGLRKLREAGVEVAAGVLEREARLRNEAFLHFHATGRPFITIKSAATLDGKIATRTGDSKWVTGEPARRYAHRLRAQSGAVLVGIGTVLADDPKLTARLQPMPPRQPLRIILDSRLRIPPNSNAVRVARENPAHMPLMIVCAEAADSTPERELASDGVEILRLPCDEAGRVDLHALVDVLADRGIISVLVDGGGSVNAAFISALLAQKALFFIAPKIVGGLSAPTPVEGEGIALMSEAAQMERAAVRRLGEDLLIEAYFSW
jgi:diaminohydroxyphosphoribosylaminopyrimidine deaminase/5-amino-6-(5-phosphoribosylamino)uracil reductase